MLHRLLPFAVLTALAFPLAASAQTPAAPPAAPGASAPKKHDHLRGKISGVDAVKRTITLAGKKKTRVVSLTPDAKIFKIGDKRRAPTGTFADLLIDTEINVHLTGDVSSDTPTADEVHLRAPKTDATPAAPAR